MYRGPAHTCDDLDRIDQGTHELEAAPTLRRAIALLAPIAVAADTEHDFSGL